MMNKMAVTASLVLPCGKCAYDAVSQLNVSRAMSTFGEIFPVVGRRVVSMIFPTRSQLSMTQRWGTSTPDLQLRRRFASDAKVLQNQQSGHGRGSTTFSWRTHTCAELRTEHVGQKVFLCGWVQFKRMTKFLTLRDGYGITQVHFDQSTAIGGKGRLLAEVWDELQLESVVSVRGVVVRRPSGQENKDMATGDVEVLADEIEVLGRCSARLPFLPRDFQKVNEPLRLKYRYLDFRSDVLQQNLRFRSKFVMRIREFLCNLHNFVDVETPTLFRRTPGGAQEFVVPTRDKGLFYALTQSPQQFKQLLMIGAIDRYFQIARCYRDENCRPDRQPEFTQVDIEMSFVTADGIMSLIEALIAHCWPREDGALVAAPFRRMSWCTAERDYGTDKPDTSFEMKLRDLPDFLTSKINFMMPNGEADFAARALVAPGLGPFLSSSMRSKMKEEAARDFNVGTLNFIRMSFGGQWTSSLTKLVDDTTQMQTSNELTLGPGDAVFLASGKRSSVNRLLGKLRVDVANFMEEHGSAVRGRSKPHNFLWIVDFPLFQRTEAGDLETMHHPFTAPHPDDLVRLLAGDFDNVRGQHYDLVLNGAEVGGGSIRIHDAALQKYVLETALKENCDSLSHLLDALASGCPPHGGIALGLDRLLAILCRASSIREVIAFPKSLEGKDLMSGAPAPISDLEKRLYHLGK